MKLAGLEHIEATPDTLGGRPRVRGTRISVAFVLELLAQGATAEQIAEGWPEVTPEAVRDALRYAALSVNGEYFLTENVPA